MTEQLPLIDVIERFLRESGMSAREFGVTVFHDPRFVYLLRKGRDVRTSTDRKARQYIAARSKPRPIKKNAERRAAA